MISDTILDAIGHTPLVRHYGTEEVGLHGVSKKIIFLFSLLRASE